MIGLTHTRGCTVDVWVERGAEVFAQTRVLVISLARHQSVAIEPSSDSAACAWASSIIAMTGDVTNRRQNHHM